MGQVKGRWKHIEKLQGISPGQSRGNDIGPCKGELYRKYEEKSRMEIFPQERRERIKVWDAHGINVTGGLGLAAP